MIVIDASALVDLLLDQPNADVIAGRIRHESIHAPHLIDTECLHALRRWSTAGALSDARGRAALEDLLGIDILRHPVAPGHALVWRLRHQLTAYDATYVALANSLDAPLVTSDTKLARAAEGLIEMVAV